MRNVGYAVFAKPKSTEDSDVDEDMLDHIDVRRYSPGLGGLIVASADGQAFREPLEEISASGVPVTVLGFREHAAWASGPGGERLVPRRSVHAVHAQDHCIAERN